MSITSFLRLANLGYRAWIQELQKASSRDDGQKMATSLCRSQGSCTNVVISGIIEVYIIYSYEYKTIPKLKITEWVQEEESSLWNSGYLIYHSTLNQNPSANRLIFKMRFKIMVLVDILQIHQILWYVH